MGEFRLADIAKPQRRPLAMRLVHVFACLFVIPVTACVRSSTPPAATSTPGSAEAEYEQPEPGFAVAPQDAPSDDSESAPAGAPAANPSAPRSAAPSPSASA